MVLKTSSGIKKPLTPEVGRVVSFNEIRKDNWRYILSWIIYYAWIVLFATWWTSSPFKENVFKMEVSSLLHIMILAFSGVLIFIIPKEGFIKTSRIGAALAVVGFGVFVAAPNPQIEFLSILTMGLAFGLINIGVLMSFVFILNNTEKLYAVVGSNVLIGLIALIQIGIFGNDLELRGNLWVASIMLAIALGSTLFLKPNDLPLEPEVQGIDVPLFHFRIYLTLLFNCVFMILCKGVGIGILKMAALASGGPVLMSYYGGSLIGGSIYFVVYARSKRPFVWLGNFTFAFFVMALFLNAFTPQVPRLMIPFTVILGIANGIGIINVYYILGVISKKYNSMRYLKLSILLILTCGGIAGVLVGTFIQQKNSLMVTSIASIGSVAVMLLFIMLSTVVSQSEYYDDWAKDSESSEIDNEQLQMFKKYKLSKREIEVCKLLLEGYTMRQTSGILSLAYPTVNTYCTSAYRKLNINSRTELLLLFKDYRTK